MRITIYCVGKLKEKYLKDAVEEYAKRLGRYCYVLVSEVSDERIDQNASDAQVRAALKLEGDRLLERFSPKDHLIALAIEGKSLSSVELSEHLGSLMNGGASSIGFIIGGSAGLSKEVLERADEAISFSKLTFPHQLMRVMLLEQVYRSFRIMRGEPYHK